MPHWMQAKVSSSEAPAYIVDIATEFFTAWTAFTCLESNPIHSSHYTGSAEKRRYSCNPLQPNTRKRWVVSITLQPLYPLERPGTHYTRAWVRDSGPIRMARKMSPPSGFNPWTVEPVASTYTDYAIPAALVQRVSSQFSVVCTTTKQWFV
jgi:hypothetical protein